MRASLLIVQMYIAFVCCVAAFAAFACCARAEVKTEEVTYRDGDVTLKGLLAYDESVAPANAVADVGGAGTGGVAGGGGKRPGILVIHEWWGCNDYAKERAAMLARLGYVAFACDMYGEGKSTTSGEEAGKLAGQFQGQDAKRVARMQAALDVLRKHPLVEEGNLGAIGYCFGGTSALKLACAEGDGAESGGGGVGGVKGLKVVVSFHGSLWDLTEAEAARIKCKVLICHGSMDNFIPVEQKNKFIATMDAARVDFQFAEYGGAVHSFTNPNAGRAGFKGVAYQEAADKRSWADMQRMVEEAFSK